MNKSIETQMGEVARDFEISISVIKNYAPAEAHPLLDNMGEMFEQVTKLCVVLAETPFGGGS